MHKSLTTVQLELTQEETALWQGRAACIGPLTAQEWTDLWLFFKTVDEFIDQVAQPLAIMQQAVAEGKAPSDGTFRKIVALAEDAKGAATLMPAIHELTSRFAMVANGKTKKEQLQ